MMANSLRLRLLLGAAAAIFVALALAWLAMTVLFSRHIERRVVTELTRQGVQLVAGLGFSSDDHLQLDESPTDPRFERPASGLYWQANSSRDKLHSRSLWDESLPAAMLAESREWTSRVMPGPFGQRVFLLERNVRLDASQPGVLIQIAVDARELGSARREFGRDLALFLAVLWLALIIAAWVQVHLGLRPLQRVREEVRTLQRNPAARLASSHPREIGPLIDAINGLADAREKDLVRARRRAADLAHSLKTPLAALGAQTRRAREAGADAAADGLERAIASAAAAVETELARSRAATMRDKATCAECSPLAVVERVIGVLERTENGETLVFESDIDDTLRVGIDADDLMEILGALLENAARFARRRVRVRAWQRESGEICVDVEDDGRGLDISVETALLRGGRLDEAGNHHHHGLGLSIVHDLVEATGGQLALARGELGGLCVSLCWPALEPSGMLLS